METGGKFQKYCTGSKPPRNEFDDPFLGIFFGKIYSNSDKHVNTNAIYNNWDMLHSGTNSIIIRSI